MHQRKVEKEMQILVCFWGFGTPDNAADDSSRFYESSSTCIIQTRACMQALNGVEMRLL
jgi:hypothetical protein